MKDEYEKCASYKMQIENVVRLKKLKKATGMSVTSSATSE